MVKSSREFKYHPVSFDDEDEEDELERALGPTSANPKTCAKILRGIVIITIILATAGAVATIALYSTMISPENGANSTDHSLDTVQGENETALVDSSEKNDTIFTDSSEENEIIEDNNVGKEANLQQNAEGSEEGSSEESITTPFAGMEENGQVSEEEQQTEVELPRTTSSDLQNNSNPNELSNPKSPSAELEQSSNMTENNSTEKEVTNEDVAKNDTSGGEKSTEDRTKNATNIDEMGRQIEINGTQPMDSTEPKHGGRVGYVGSLKQEDLIAAAILLSVSFFMITCATCCVLRLIRKRRRQKKQHFSRLVNDLNATEKFTIVSPSDDEISE